MASRSVDELMMQQFLRILQRERRLDFCQYMENMYKEFMMIPEGPNQISLRDVMKMSSLACEHRVFLPTRRNKQAVDALLTERAWLITLEAASQFYYYHYIRESVKAQDIEELKNRTKRKKGERKKKRDFGNSRVMIPKRIPSLPAVHNNEQFLDFRRRCIAEARSWGMLACIPTELEEEHSYF